ncbi:MAG: hypothetical protein IK024_13410 [Treponema sp.]|nr:hypothetical protein [Treponema sp.]
MKKALFLMVSIISFFFVLGCSADSKAEPEFVEFSTTGDISWIEGTWELIKWETDNKGTMEDNTNIYVYQYLTISKDTVVQESKSSSDNKVTSYTYSFNDYFQMYNHKVNGNKTKILLSREYASDPEVIFYFTFQKQ